MSLICKIKYFKILNQRKYLTWSTKLRLLREFSKKEAEIRERYKLHNWQVFNNIYCTFKKSKFENEKETNSFFKKELPHLKREYYKNKVIALYVKFSNFFKKINLKRILDLKNSQNNVQLFFSFLSRQLTNYRTAIQELVEGQREVTLNKNFKFDDGQTVNDRLTKFEDKLKENLNLKNKFNKNK